MHPAIQYAMDREREERTALRDEFAAAALQGMLADVSRHQPRVGPLRLADGDQPSGLRAG